MIPIDMESKVVLVTGAGSGMGFATAYQMAKAGAVVMLADLNSEAAIEKSKFIVEKTGKECIPFKCNVAIRGEVEAMVEMCTTKFGRIDSMVNCAGIAMRKSFGEFTQQDIDSIYDIDLKGVLYGTIAAGKKMTAQGFGSIVNFSSIAARLGAPLLTLYGSAKAGVIAITQSLGREFAAHGVRVNAVLPGHVRTAMWEKELNIMTNNGNEQEKDKRFAEVLHAEGVPLGRPQEPEDIANAVVFLCSDLAKNITAQCLSIDGGSTVSF